jgi:hypothetical protein
MERDWGRGDKSIYAKNVYKSDTVPNPANPNFKNFCRD